MRISWRMRCVEHVQLGYGNKCTKLVPISWFFGMLYLHYSAMVGFYCHELACNWLIHSEACNFWISNRLNKKDVIKKNKMFHTVEWSFKNMIGGLLYFWSRIFLWAVTLLVLFLKTSSQWTCESVCRLCRTSFRRPSLLCSIKGYQVWRVCTS